MRALRTLLLDDGGVINDNARRTPQWQRLAGEHFAPLLGGTPRAWADANARVFDRLWPTLRKGPEPDQSLPEWWDGYLLHWLRGMAERVGIAVPASDGACVRLAREANDYVAQHLRAEYPGAREAIRTLHAGGYELLTASGTFSWDLATYLRTMEVVDCFGTLYGPDLIDRAKNGPAYYERLLAHAGIDPASALLLDDSPQHLAWAASTGVRTCLVGSAPTDAFVPDMVISRLAALPAALPLA